MTEFQDDLDAWAQAQLAQRSSRLRRTEIDRLLRAQQAGQLPAVRPGSALPAEVRTFSRVADVTLAPEIEALQWLCWPSSDDAEFGWGHPYENPPGTPVNPPLGTVQTAFSDTARIARELDHLDQVTHGVNKIAGLRDWRSDTSQLVLSWDDDGIYSKGTLVKAGADIRAACIRYTDQTPYLIWLETNSSPSRIWSQECAIEDDGITTLIGSADYCTITVSVDIWSEFSQSGNKLAVSYGSSLTNRVALEYAVPATFTGQQASFIVLGTTDAHIIDYTNGSLYDGSRTFLMKFQYINDTAVSAKLQVQIQRGVISEVLTWESVADLGWPEEPTFFRCAGCGASDGSMKVEGFGFFQGVLYPQHGYKKIATRNGFVITAHVLFDDIPAYSKILADDSTYGERWCPTDNEDLNLTCASIGHEGVPAVGDEPILPGPSEIGDWPCIPSTVVWPPETRCIPVDEVYPVPLEDHDDQTYEIIPQDTLDARFSRFAHVALGTSADNGATKNKKLELGIYRNGTKVTSKSLPGEYGHIPIPDRSDVLTEQQLRDEIDLLAFWYCPTSGIGVTGSFKNIDMAALDLSDIRSVQWIRAQEETSGEYEHINLLEGSNIETLLAIDGEIRPRIVIHDSNRFFGLLARPGPP